MTVRTSFRLIPVGLRVVTTWVLFSVATALAADRVQVTVLGTTDLHGRVYPVDYFTGRPAEVGLAKLATLIAEARRSAPDLLLLDCGDTIQGTPLVYYHNRKNNSPPDPMMLVMNSLGYTAMAVGNHEYNFGLAVFEKARQEAAFPWLSANSYRTESGETAFQPYVVREVKGVRIGVLGMTTPAIPNWENPENYAGLEFRPLVSEARKWVAVLREKERVDAVIVAMHSGVEESLATGRRPPGNLDGENAAFALAREVDGIDLMLLGHTHREIPALVVDDVLICQAGRWGDNLARADLTFSREEGGPWKLIARTGQLIPVTAETTADPRILALAEPYHRETEAWLSQEIGRSDRRLDASRAHLEDSALLDLIHRAQLEAGGADVSFTANFNFRASIPEGRITVRDIAGLYVYENTLYVIEATGAQVKAALEHSARYFRPHEEGKTAGDLIDPSIPGYNFDIAEGVSYTIDLRRPVGDRIVDLEFQGQPLAPDRVLRVAVNNYRYNGGGAYTMFSGAKVLGRSSEEIRDLVIGWVERHGEVPSKPSGNWRILH